MITPDQVVDAMNARFGRHLGLRALHAKGVLLKGTFTATPEAAALTRATHLQGDAIPVTVRVSNGSGDPGDPDYASDVRGFAVKLYLPDGSRTDIVAQTAPRFPVRSPEGFVEFVRAAAQPWRLPIFLARNPTAIAGLKANAVALKRPESYASVRYYAIHAYRWVDAEGGARHVRYRLSPPDGEAHVSGGEAKSRGRDYLVDEIVERLPFRMDLEVQVVRAGDDVDDPTSPWRDDEPVVRVGALELTARDTDRETGDDVLIFDPARVTDGIELTDDPILRFRPQAYGASVERRT